MIVSQIHGGLGNQMFQYAAGRALALRNGQPFKLDLSQMKGYTLHPYMLDQFAIRTPMATTAEIPKARKRDLQGIIQAFARFAFGRRTYPPAINEAGLRFDPNVFAWKGPAHLRGYWQCEKYFADHARTIRRDFQPSLPFGKNRSTTLEAINGASHPVSVHVRRGDYASDPETNAIHGTCSPAWYETAMQAMIAKRGGVSFFVFSDDPAWAKANIQSHEPLFFVEPQSDGLDSHDMHLMAACNDHIIANSSFSWWGAWLNERADKHVIAPKQWFQTAALDASDIVPESWKRM